MDPAIKNIQIYGERCSGTNYLQLLLQQNLESVRVRPTFGWKHFFHKEGVEAADDYLFVIIYRNPFDWLRSINKKPHHAAPELRKNDFSDFIRKEWWCIWDEQAKKRAEKEGYGTEMMFERDPETGERFANVVRLRAAKIRNWESLRDKTKNNMYVRYEDLAANPEAFINTLSERFGIARTPTFTNIKGFKGRSEQFRPKTYQPIKADDMQHILRELDVQLEQRIGYNVEELAAELGAAVPIVSSG